MIAKLVHMLLWNFYCHWKTSLYGLLKVILCSSSLTFRPIVTKLMLLCISQKPDHFQHYFLFTSCIYLFYKPSGDLWGIRGMEMSEVGWYEFFQKDKTKFDLCILVFFPFTFKQSHFLLLPPFLGTDPPICIQKHALNPIKSNMGSNVQMRTVEKDHSMQWS